MARRPSGYGAGAGSTALRRERVRRVDRRSVEFHLDLVEVAVSALAEVELGLPVGGAAG